MAERCTAGVVGPKKGWWAPGRDYRCPRGGVRSVTAWGITGWLCASHAAEVERLLAAEANVEVGR